MLTQDSLYKVEVTSLITTSNDLLIKAQWPRLTVGEQRLVLYMLALVEKGDEDFKNYRISVRELGNILGSRNDNLYIEFDKATDGLMTKIIKWIDPAFKDKVRLQKVTWCSSAMLAEGEGFVELCFDPKLKPFLLALKGNFTQYELKAVIRLKNHYSLRLYQLMKYHQGMARVDNREAVMVDLEWLKEFLGVSSEGYKHFGHFKSKILVPTQKEILDKTDIKFSYQKVKESKKVVAIRFSWAVNPKYNQLEMPIFSEIKDDEGDFEKAEKPPIQKQEAIDNSENPVIKRLLDYGLNYKTVRKVLAGNTPEGVNDTLNYIEKAYLNPGKGHQPIGDLKAYIATCLNLPKGSVTRKPKIQIEREKKIEREQKKREEEARAREELEKIEMISSNYRSLHREAMENRIKELVSEKNLKWPAIIADFMKQAPSYVLSYLEKITTPNERGRAPYTKDNAIKKDPMIKEEFFKYLKVTFLTEEEIDFQLFVKKNAKEEEYEILRTRLWEESERQEN